MSVSFIFVLASFLCDLTTSHL